MTDEWATVNGPFPPLPDDIVFIRHHEDDHPVIVRGTRRLWVATVFDRVLVADPKQLPACRVQVLALPDRIYVLFGLPIPMSPRIERTADLNADLDLVASAIINWPNVIDVTVCEAGPLTDAIIVGLVERGVEAASGPLEGFDISVSWDDDFDEDGRGWFLNLDSDDRPPFKVGFGLDLEALAAVIGSLSTDGRVLEVNASRPRRDALTPLLDATDVRWRVHLARDHDWFAGQTTWSQGMAMQLTVSNYGWIDLRWRVAQKGLEEHELRLDVSSNGDGWAQLAEATRVAVVDHHAVCFVLTRDDVSMRVIFIPDGRDRLRIECWYDKHGEWWAADKARTKKSYVHWSGPARALAAVVAGASQSLIEVATPDGIADLWGMPIPSNHLEALSAWLKETA